MILGTAAYMSPEQARGKAVDRRADIWAFGAVLFEMLAGQRLFGGETISDTLASCSRPIRTGNCCRQRLLTVFENFCAAAWRRNPGNGCKRSVRRESRWRIRDRISRCYRSSLQRVTESGRGLARRLSWRQRSLVSGF